MDGPMTAVEHFRTLHAYEQSCTGVVLDSLKRSKANIEQLGLASLAAPYQRGVDIFSHIQLAKRVWLHRIDPSFPGPREGIFPVWPLDQAEQEALEMDAALGAYVARLDDRELVRVVAYARVEDSRRFSSLVRHILTQVYNHASYHRGQIASLVAQTGVKPGATDYILQHRAEL